MERSNVTPGPSSFGCMSASNWDLRKANAAKQELLESKTKEGDSTVESGYDKNRALKPSSVLVSHNSSGVNDELPDK